MPFFLCNFKEPGGAGQAAFLFSCCVPAPFRFDHRTLPGGIAFRGMEF